MKDIFVESVNSYQGLDDIRKDAIISLYRTLFEADESKEKKEEKKEEKKDDKKEDKKDDKKEPNIIESEDGEFRIKRNLSPINLTPAKNRVIKYIALHYTAGNSSAPGEATRVTFRGNCSSDFIVDDGEIYQFNPDLDNYNCHAVGVNSKEELENYIRTAKIPNPARLYRTATNKNTISIEMCSNFNGKRPKDVSPYDRRFSLSEATLANTAKLVAYLLKKYPTIQEVIRHFDVTGKPCPAPWCWDDEGNQKYVAFVQRCHSTPAPDTPEYDNVDDGMLEKNDEPPWPDFGKYFSPDKTATTAADIATGLEGNEILDTLSKSLGIPGVKVIGNIITKNLDKVDPRVVKDFVGMLFNPKNKEMLKNVLNK